MVAFGNGPTGLRAARRAMSGGAEVFGDFAVEHGALTWCDGVIHIAPEGLYRRTYERCPLPVAL